MKTKLKPNKNRGMGILGFLGLFVVGSNWRSN